jgi:outer membrane lipoprotein-sorting protein
MNHFKRTVVILAVMLAVMLAVLASPVAHAQDIRTGEALLRAMHDRYQNSWYHTLTFTQKSTTYKPDGTSTAETWYEAALLPGKLRIDIGPASDGKGYVLVDGTATILKDNKIAGTRPLVNMLLVLGFDVYTQAPETTIKVVQGEGYDLSKVREDVWEGHPAYVVGADKGDLKAKQFWIAKDTLLFVRVIEPSRGDPNKLDDIRFTDYRPLAGTWVAARVEVHSDDKLVFSEDYTDIQANVKLDPAVFDPQQFATTHWEK